MNTLSPDEACDFSKPGEAARTAAGAGQWGGVPARGFEELRAIMLQHCRCIPVDQLWQVLRPNSFTSRCVLQLGITVLQLLLLSPADGATIDQALRVLTNNATQFLQDRDILPLPVPPVGAVTRLCKMLPVMAEGLLVWEPQALRHVGRQQRSKLIKASCFQIWRLLSVVIINGEYLGWRPPLFSPKVYPGVACQQAAFDHLGQLCEYFTLDPLCEESGLSPEALIKSKGVDYTGEEILHALPLRVGELLPGLPADGVAGSLQALDIAGEEVACWLRCPELALLPKERWPSPLPIAGMNCSRAEWLELVPILYKKGILAPIGKEEILKVGDQLLLNGAFAVLKKGVPAPNEDKVTRLIMNMIPGNSIQRLMPGDLDTLSSSPQWVSLET